MTSKLANFDLFVDAGSPSWYNKFAKREKGTRVMGTTFMNRRYDDIASYTHSEAYVKYVTEHSKAAMKEHLKSGHVSSRTSVLSRSFHICNL